MSLNNLIDPYSPSFSDELETIIQTTAYVVCGNPGPDEIFVFEDDQYLKPSKIISIIQFFIEKDIEDAYFDNEALVVPQKVFKRIFVSLDKHPIAKEIYDLYTLQNIYKTFLEKFSYQRVETKDMMRNIRELRMEVRDLKQENRELQRQLDNPRLLY